MKATVKIGTKEGFVSSYNLLFDNGLLLKTTDLTWVTAADSADILRNFKAVVDALRVAGVTIEGMPA